MVYNSHDVIHLYKYVAMYSGILVKLLYILFNFSQKWITLMIASYSLHNDR